MGNKKQQPVFFYKLLNLIFENKKTEKLLPDVLDILASAVGLRGGVLFLRYRGTQTDTKSNKLRRTGITKSRKYRESVRQ